MYTIQQVSYVQGVLVFYGDFILLLFNEITVKQFYWNKLDKIKFIVKLLFDSY